MNAQPVNIAEFRCRVIKFRSIRPVPRTLSTQAGLAIVSSRRRQEATGLTRIYDIAAAREAQRNTRRLLSRPAPIQRRAKVIRFHEASAAAAVQQMPALVRAAEGPCDLPPAA